MTQRAGRLEEGSRIRCVRIANEIVLLLVGVELTVRFVVYQQDHVSVRTPMTRVMLLPVVVELLTPTALTITVCRNVSLRHSGVSTCNCAATDD